MKRSQQAIASAAMAERRAPPNADRGSRFASFAPNSYDAESHSVEAVLSAGSQVKRWGFVEELEISDQAIDLSRVQRGLVPLLNAHDQWAIGSVLGTVSDVRVINGTLTGTLNFGATEAAAEAEGMVSRGELRGISIGYRVTQWQITNVDEMDNETWRATAWELLEVSLVPVPADSAAGVRSAAENLNPGNGDPAANQKDDDMKRNLPGGAAAPAVTTAGLAAAPAAELARGESASPAAPATAAPAASEPAPAPTVARFGARAALDFVESARFAGETCITRANELLDQNERGEISIDTARARLNEAIVEQARTATGGIATGGRAIEIPAQQFVARASAVTGAVLNLCDPGRYALDQNSRDFGGQSLRSLARSHLEAMGTSTRGMTDVAVAQAVFQRSAGMMTTSDFSNILGNTVNRTLRDGYTLAPRTFQGWARRARASDFRPITRVALSDAPELRQVDEHGEYTFGSVGDSAETYRLIKYGRIFAVTWETIINDDLDALSRIPMSFGMRAAQTENEVVYSKLLDNPTMADGYALFSAEHGNLAGSGAGVGDATLAAGRLAMRKQTAPGGGKLSVRPSLLIVGPEEETNAEKYTSSAYVPATQTNIAPEWQRSLQITAESLIEDHAWFLAANPNTQGIDTVEYAYLDGEEGLMISQREGWEVDGLEIKARLVFGAGVIDHRGLYKNPGS